MINGNSVNGEEQLLRALEQLWKQDPLVHEFHLHYRPEAITQNYGLWSVPVASGVQGGSSTDLRRALSSIQKELEDRTHLDITVLLMPDNDAA